MKFLRLLASPLAFVVVGIIRLISKRRLVRFGLWESTRLGHLIGNMECYLSEKDNLLQPDSYDIFFPIGSICNRYIYRKYRQKIHVWPSWLVVLIWRVNALFMGWEKHIVRNLQFDRDIKNLFSRYSPHVRFTKAEEKKGQKLLRYLGIPEGAKWVCLIVRDNAYLKMKAPGLDFSYHDYRDADVSEYIPAAVELARRGYYVIRMGEIIAKPFNVKHTKIIDYPFKRKGLMGEFGDLYLGAKCAFCLGTPTGFMAIPQAFNRPLGITDFVPIEYAPTWCQGLMIWKHHLKDGKKMTVREIVDSGMGLMTFGGEFEKAGITLENNTPQEIFELAMEMADRDQGISIEQPQTGFWGAFPNSVVNGKPLHGKMVLRIGREFLKANQ